MKTYHPDSNRADSKNTNFYQWATQQIVQANENRDSSWLYEAACWPHQLVDQWEDVQGRIQREQARAQRRAEQAIKAEARRKAEQEARYAEARRRAQAEVDARDREWARRAEEAWKHNSDEPQIEWFWARNTNETNVGFIVIFERHMNTEHRHCFKNRAQARRWIRRQGFSINQANESVRTRIRVNGAFVHIDGVIFKN